ncbi:hypothetical protein NDU88_010657 [Pleurodeles waltl]|uniref:Uncharacterized protein n=1 Tax=Pleurodeles waltl TaxID=8319 RepID=A0AAV7PVU6_PLEWA|nr:hypothetical protein NDU88_010657 [Pleurodeles waltl]
MVEALDTFCLEQGQFLLYSEILATASEIWPTFLGAPLLSATVSMRPLMAVERHLASQVYRASLNDLPSVPLRVQCRWEAVVRNLYLSGTGKRFTLE